MKQPTTVIVGPSALRLLGALVLLNVCVPLILGRMLLVVGCAVVAALSVVVFVIAMVRQKPGLVITPEGFRREWLFRSQSRNWADVDGQFAVVKSGLGKAVGYNLTADCKARASGKATPSPSGYDAVITRGLLRLPARDLAELLNEHKSRYEEQGRPSDATPE